MQQIALKMTKTLSDYEGSGVQEKTRNSVIAITGAHGFIGKRLVEKFLERGDVLIRSLVRCSNAHSRKYHNFTEIQGDLTKSETLSDFLLPGCSVINLAYGFESTPAENIRMTENLIEICKTNQVKRFIHCSTAAVFGVQPADIVNEESICNPKTEYGLTKLLIEQKLQDGARGHFEFINLRPTSVFGPGGVALSKLISDITKRSMVLNYLRSCLFNKRRFNLVSVETLIAAILFIFDKGKEVDGQTYIVSEDDESINDFEFIEKYFLQELCGKYYYLPPLKLPLNILSVMMIVYGKEFYNPRIIYDSSKIRKIGFQVPRPLISSLAEYIQWKKNQSSFNPAKAHEDTER
jgi:nucleoside-diphosphate-sugar epimerase